MSTEGLGLTAAKDALGATTTDDDATDDSSAGDDVTAEPEFTPTYDTDAYLAYGDTRSCAATIVEENVVDGMEDVTLPEVTPKELDLDNLDESLATHGGDDAHPQELLWLVYSHCKGAFGDAQAENHDHGVGLNKSGDHVKPVRSSPEDGQFYYADEHGDLPTLETRGLTTDEKEMFEDAGVDPVADLGFREDRGPMVPVIDGTRLPLFANTIEGVKAVIDLLEQADPPGTDRDPVADDDSDDATDDASSGDSTDDASDDNEDEEVAASDEVADLEWSTLQTLGSKDYLGVAEVGMSKGELREAVREALGDRSPHDVLAGDDDGEADATDGGSEVTLGETNDLTDDDNPDPEPSRTDDEASDDDRSRADFVADMIEAGVDPKTAEAKADERGY